MTHKKQHRVQLAALAAFMLAGTLLSGCASRGGGLYQPPAQPLQETVPFSITFDMKGNPIVVDREGQLISPKDVEFPVINVRAIATLNTITAMEVHGSHYYILKIGGNTYHIPLPAPHPQ